MYIVLKNEGLRPLYSMNKYNERKYKMERIKMTL